MTFHGDKDETNVVSTRVSEYKLCGYNNVPLAVSESQEVSTFFVKIYSERLLTLLSPIVIISAEWEKKLLVPVCP